MLDHSQTLFARAQRFIPGGVNSPVRAFKSVGGTPVFFQKAEGSVLTDADGNTYIDYVGSWGPMILGHAHPKVVAAVQDAATRSTSFGAPTEVEIELAELVLGLTGIEKVRMVNSGTEACMSAVRVARGYTHRNKIIKFIGCYHGHGDSFLIKAGSGATTLGTPDSPGVTPGTAQDTLTAPYNDLDAVEALFEANAGEIAAIIVEPIAGNMGCIPPVEGFLEGLRRLCDAHESLLIFDEVMTGFRITPGGVQQYAGVKPDLVTYGKVIGGGLPVGAFGGRAEVMNVVSPVGPVYQAGTLSGNPLAMHAGKALLSELRDHPEHYETLDRIGYQLEAGWRDSLTKAGIPHRINRVQSMISVHFCDVDVTDFETASQTDQASFRSFFHGLLQRGVYLPPSAFESLFLSAAITEAQLDHTLSATREVVATWPATPIAQS